MLSIYNSYRLELKERLGTDGRLLGPVTLINIYDFQTATKKEDVVTMFFNFAGDDIDLTKSIYYEFEDVNFKKYIILEDFISKYDEVVYTSFDVSLFNISMSQLRQITSLLRDKGVNYKIKD